VQLAEYIDVDQFTKDIDTEQTDISEAMRTQTAKAAYYGIQLAKAQRQSAKAKLVLRTLEAKKGKEYRKDITDAGEKPTAQLVQEFVDTDNAVVKMRDILNNAEEIEHICKVAYEAFRTRRDMLTGLGMMTRAELNSGVRVSSGRREANNYRERRAARQAAEAGVASDGE